MKPITLMLSFFRSLNLEHLEKTLYSLSRQTVKPEKYLLFDNNTAFTSEQIQEQVAKHFRLADWQIFLAKHGDNNKTLSWSGNHAVHLCDTDVFAFVRADFIYSFDWLEKTRAQYEPMSIVTCPMFQMNYYEGIERTQYDAVDLEQFMWRDNPHNLQNNKEGSRIERNCHIDSPSFVTDKGSFRAQGGYDESLIAWGHPQQDLQLQMARAGVKVKVIPEVLCYHMDHGPMEGDARDKGRAMQQWQASPRRSPEEQVWMSENVKLAL